MIRTVRIAAVAIYLGVAALALIEGLGVGSTDARAAHVFWTMLMPAIPALVIVIGFHRWRALCPIATVGSAGARLWSKLRGRPPRSWVDRSMFISLTLLAAALWLRLVAINGDALLLGAFLLALPVVALVVNARWGGRAFCHVICPVAIVERIYTDGDARVGVDSRCSPCTGCVRSCPDIGAQASYESSLGAPARRHAFYAFPGLVLAFYSFFYVRGGSWDAFFDGQWTLRRASSALWLEPVLGAPACVTAALWLGAGMALSFWAFASVEAALRRTASARVVRHRTLVGSSFVALNLFYVFAGGPSLALLPWAPRIVAFAVPTLATFVVFRRLSIDVHVPRKDVPAPRRLPVLRTATEGNL